MKVHLAWVTTRAARNKNTAAGALANDYLARIGKFAEVNTLEAIDETALMNSVKKLAGRSKPFLVLLDSTGRQRTSEEIATLIRERQQQGTQHLLFAIGGANGWSDQMKQASDDLLSLGKITLPHELARVVLAEQIYRAFTILAGHPYHSGH